MPSLRPHHLYKASDAAAAELWEDSLSFTCRLERGEFRLVVRKGGGARQEGGGQARS